MSGERYIGIEEALKTVKAYGDREGYTGTLETLEAMQMDYVFLNRYQQRCLARAMTGFAELLRLPEEEQVSA